MKRVLILLLGCLPLAALTLWSFFEPAPKAPSVSESQSVEAQVDEARKLADAVLDRDQRDEPAAEQLDDVELLSERPVKPAEVQAATKALTEAAEGIQEARKAGQLLDKLEGVPLCAPPWTDNILSKEPLEQAVEARKRLDRFIAENKNSELGKIPGADKVFAFLENRRDRIDKEIAILKLVLQGYKQFFEENKYPEAIATLNEAAPETIQDPRKRQLVEAVIRRYLSRAKYWRDRAAAPRTIADLESFFRQHPNSPDASDEKMHRRLRQELDALKVEDVRGKSIEQLQAAIKALGKADNLKNLKKSADELQRQVEKSQDLKAADKAELRSQARGAIADWLTTVGFPRKTPPPRLLEKDNQEAVANNKRYIGNFVLDINFYRYWQWDKEKDHVRYPGGDDKIEKIQIARLEPSPMYVQWASFYNDASELLARGGADPKGGKALHLQWSAYFEQCKKVQADFDRYRNQWGTTHEPDLSCKEWTFLPDRNVLAHRDFDDLSRQLEDLWLVLQP